MTSSAPEPNGSKAGIRETYQLVSQVEERLASQLRDVEQRLLSALERHERDHDQSARRGRHWVSALLTAVGIVASLSVGVLALVLR